jgi:hypothetical protein
VAESLHAIAVGAPEAYEAAVARVLASFEARDEYLEGIAVADTVLVLQELARARGLTASLHASLLPPDAP